MNFCAAILFMNDGNMNEVFFLVVAGLLCLGLAVSEHYSIRKTLALHKDFLSGKIPLDVDDTLKKELLDLIEQKRYLQAAQRYCAATGETRKKAGVVIEHLDDLGKK